MKHLPTIVACDDVEGNTYEVEVSKLSFRPAVYGVLVNDGKVLLSKQWDGYDFPGGGIELGETIHEALIREVKEETGMDVRIGSILHAESSFFKLPYKGNFVHSIHLYYACTAIGGELSINYLDENEKQYASIAEWIDLSDISSLKIFSSADSNKVLESFVNHDKQTQK